MECSFVITEIYMFIFQTKDQRSLCYLIRWIVQCPISFPYLYHMLTFLLPLLSLFTSGEQPSTPQMAVQPATGDNSLLWEISGNGLSEPSYLFGTIHIIGEKDFFFPKAFEKALKKTSRLVMEIDIADIAGQISALNKVMLDSGRTLADLYTAEEYDFIRQTAIDSLQVDIGMFATMKPVFVQQAIMTGPFGEETESYELHLAGLALKHGIPTAGLETVSEQMAILDSIPLQVQADMLLESMKNLSASDHVVNEMIKHYKAQNLDSLYALFEGDKDYSQFQGSLLDNRNRKWIPLIEQFMKEAPAFIAVGAGHLGGPGGLIRLLREKGYTVTAVRT